ncbi:MAG: hypothetical protein CML03_01770 [Pseudooceanicola sp.]|jgi:hypothetical protein|nr:hypothetical protein [Pseudooceanicola sp.]|tara:strand:- start:10461 stop:10736 length:276 start_codon:yes stop_codon:yes gene_type:complete
MSEDLDVNDPKGLIRESYRIDGLGEAECRSILIDWALSLPDSVAQKDALSALIARHADQAHDHPMTRLMSEGLHTFPVTGRRGGWAARRKH